MALVFKLVWCVSNESRKFCPASVADPFDLIVLSLWVVMNSLRRVLQSLRISYWYITFTAWLYPLRSPETRVNKISLNFGFNSWLFCNSGVATSITLDPYHANETSFACSRTYESTSLMKGISLCFGKYIPPSSLYWRLIGSSVDLSLSLIQSSKLVPNVFYLFARQWLHHFVSFLVHTCHCRTTESIVHFLGFRSEGFARLATVFSEHPR